MFTRCRLFAALLCLIVPGQRAFADGQMAPGTTGSFPVQGSQFEGSGQVANDWGIYILSGNAAQEIATRTTPNGWSVAGAVPSSLAVTAPGSAIPGQTCYVYYTTSTLTHNPDLDNTYTGQSAQFHIMPVKPAPAPGPPQPWQGNVDGINTGNGNKTTSISLVSWMARGGMPISFALTHNSESSAVGPYSPKWTASYDVYMQTDSSGNWQVHWGNGQVDKYTPQMAHPTFSTPAGVSSTLNTVTNTLTTENQNVYHFTQNNAMNRAYLDTITDENGNRIVITRLTDGRLNTIADPTGRTLSFGYDSSGRLATVTDPLSRVWAIGYDGSGNLASVQWPVLNGVNYHIALGYNGSHDITSKSNLYGEYWTFGYNGDDSTAWEQDPCSNRTTFGYGPTNTTITDANNHTTTHTYSLQLASSSDPLNKSESTTYNWNNQPTYKQDKRGHGITWFYGYSYTAYSGSQYDPQNVTTYVKETDPTPTDYAVTVTDYSTHGKLLDRMDPNHNTVTYAYDGNGNPYLATDMLGHATHMDHVWGVLTKVTDALGHATTFTPDNDGNITQTTDANNNTTKATYNGLGWKTSSTNGVGQTTTYTYDNWGRVTAVTDADGHATHTVYDGNSNVLTVTDANNNTTTNTYDNNNRLLTTTNGRGDVVTYVYDGAGQHDLLSQKIDGNGHAITYTYTARNETASAAYADGTGEAWSYDANGNLSTHTRPEGSLITYTYDLDNRLWQTLYQNTNVNANVTFVYDLGGRRTQMTDGIGVTKWGYDNGDRLTEIATPYNTIDYTYDNANRRATMTEGNGVGVWTYGYDNGNRLTSLLNPFNETTGFTYWGDNSLWVQTNAQGRTTTYGYDNETRVTSVQWGTASSPAADGWDNYAYDYGGRMTQKTANDGGTTIYSYDGADQLCWEQRNGGNAAIAAYTFAYDYDRNGNRKTKDTNGQRDTYTYFAGSDKLQQVQGPWGTKTYAYDSNGDIRTIQLNGVTTVTLATDYNGQPFSIQYGNGAVDTFRYNGLDQRVYYKDGGGIVHTDTYDGADPGAALLSDGFATYTPGISEHRADGSHFYMNDALGSPRGIRNSSGSMTDDERFEAFGGTVYHGGTSPTTTPYGWEAGKAHYQTDTSGLILMGHRFYDSSTGRFLSPDPVHDGENWYAYCENNPLDKTDPSGETSKGKVDIDAKQIQDLKDEIEELKKEHKENTPRAKEIQKKLDRAEKSTIDEKTGKPERSSRASREIKTKAQPRESKPSSAERKMARKAELREEVKQAVEESVENHEKLAIIEDVVEIDAGIVVVGAVVK